MSIQTKKAPICRKASWGFLYIIIIITIYKFKIGDTLYMKIIDKNTDFYDYLQNVYRDNSITFDRTDSYLLTKSMLCDKLYGNHSALHDHNLLLLQVCNTFWLFLTEVTEIDNNNPYCDTRPSNYRVELLATWKNYSKTTKLIKFDIISFKFSLSDMISNGTLYRYGYYSRCKLDREKLINKLDAIIQAIDTNDYRVENSMNKSTVTLGDGSCVEKHIPLLKACGVANLINPLEIYLAFEEYFSRKKTESERTESIGITDTEKIENHGFDTKVSFRGKLH